MFAIVASSSSSSIFLLPVSHGCPSLCAQAHVVVLSDLSGEEIKESLITGRVHLGFSDLECCGVGICASLPALFTNLPDYSPCAEK